MKNINVTLEDHVHARLKAFARLSRMTLADALRYALDHCLPEMPDGEPEAEHVDAEDTQADE